MTPTRSTPAARLVLAALAGALAVGLGWFLLAPREEARAQDRSVLQALADDVRHVAGEARPAVVTVTARSGPASGSAPAVSMSGVVVDPSGEIVSFGAELASARVVEVRFPSGEVRAAEVVGVDPDTRIALLRVPADEPLPAVSLAPDGTPPEVGTPVVAVGNPYGLRGTVSLGNVAGVQRMVEIGGRSVPRILQVTNPVNPGDPGGLLVDPRGRMVGLLASTFRDVDLPSPEVLDEAVSRAVDRIGRILSGEDEGAADPAEALRDLVRRVGETGSRDEPRPAGRGLVPGGEGISWAFPADVVEGALDRIRSGSTGPRGYLGVRILALDPGIRARLGLEDEDGVLVLQVVPGGPADEAGIRRRDVIRSFRGEPVRDSLAFRQAVLETETTEPVEIEILRGDEPLTVPVELEIREPSEGGRSP